MNDFAFVGIILAFFILAALFVAACDRIIGAEDGGTIEEEAADAMAPGRRAA